MAIQAQFYSDNFGFSLGDSLMENGCGFDNLCLTPQQQHQFMHFPNHKYLNFFLDNNVQFHQQEFEDFLNLQNERLRLALEEQRKQQEAVLINKYESKTRVLLTQKDEEIAKASNRTKELQSLLKKMEMESQAWERAAKENESMVASLNGLIQRVRESVFLSENVVVEDAESCCPEEEHTKKLVCKCCNSRNSCVIMLPCRHLSSCQDCHRFLDSCPLCRMPKKATIEALI